MSVPRALLDFQGKFDFQWPLEEKIRIDHFLQSQSDHVSRSFWVKCLEKKGILVNEGPVKKNYMVKLGDRIQFDYYELCRRLKNEELSQKIDYEIVYDHPEYVVLNKSSGCLIHRIGFLDYSLASQASQDIGTELYIVHRLDKFTSGVCLFAKSSKAADRLQTTLKAGGIEKYYLVATQRRLPKTSGLFTEPIGAGDPKIHKKFQIVDYEHGLHAKTRYRYALSKGKVHYYLVRIFTGRQHQIRVHFQFAGAPVLNDELYSYDDYSHLGLMYQFSEVDLGLHAYKLRFQCPFDQEMKTVKSLPDRRPFWNHIIP